MTLVKRRPGMPLGSAAVLVVLCGAVCAAPRSAPRDTPVDAPLAERLAKVKAAIDEAIGEARAERVEDCRVIAFGSKPCGGPWLYLVYSSAQSDAGRLEKLVADYDALEERRNAEQGLVSDCMFVGPPEVAVVDGRCAARGR